MYENLSYVHSLPYDPYIPDAIPTPEISVCSALSSGMAANNTRIELLWNVLNECLERTVKLASAPTTFSVNEPAADISPAPPCELIAEIDVMFFVQGKKLNTLLAKVGELLQRVRLIGN